MKRAEFALRRRIGSSLVVAACLASGVAGFAGAAGAELAVGDPAPAFSLPGSDGSTHSLARYLGKQAVVLAWFPKAFTPG